MEKDSYSLEEILSEVKQRRAREEGAEGNSQKSEIPRDKINNKKSDTDIKTDIKSKKAIEKKTENNPPEKNADAKAKPKPEEKSAVKEKTKKAEPVKEAKQSQAKTKTDAAPAAQKKQPSYEKAAVKKAPEAKKEKPKKNASQEEMIDLLSFSQDAPVTEEPEEKSGKKSGFFKTKKGKAVKAVLIILLALVLCGGAFGGIYIYRALNSITDDSKPVEQLEEWQGMSKLVENYPEINETDASQLTSLQDMIKDWYYNGAPSSSTHVLNVLLIGEDTRGEEILDEETRADSSIIVSVNIDTKKITLTSVLRDTYTYWEEEPGNEDTGKFGKICEAMLGGIGTYINCVEKMYKIDIDNYVIVNFESFQGIIDSLGGVSLELDEREINEINNHPKRYKNVTIEKTFEGDSGVLKLTGEQALAYCRIRYIDSDNARADRQKECLNQIFLQLKDGNSLQLLKVVDKLIPYVKTGFSGGEVVSIAKYALSQGWLDFEINMASVPYSRINERLAGGEYYGAWVWKADFPQDAHYLQTLLYGKSPIILAQERVDVLQCNEYGFYSETLTPTWARITNTAYGETTTYDFQVKEEEETSDTSSQQNNLQ